MDFRVFAILSLWTSVVFGQNISGRVADSAGNPIVGAELFSSANGLLQTTGTQGEFSFALSTGTHEITLFKEGFALQETVVTSPAAELLFVLERTTQLSEVVVNSQRERIAALTKLRDIEGTAIYAGKKTEVVAIGKLTANKAANNARQIFSQVVGLTINESSDGGLQLSIGGRGLDPNRTSNFNTRQNGYDISADVLGYPESYYAPPTEGLEEIQIVRGAASLQYGTQFGGLVNFVMKKPSAKAVELSVRNTLGSYGLFTNFTSLSGTAGKFSYYTFYNYKQGDGFRPNSQFSAKNYFANFNYNITGNTSLHFDYTYFDYLAQQPGGLTDVMFLQDPSQSNRTRNWFDVNWNLFALRLNHKFPNKANFSLQLFALDASRKAVGYRANRVSNADTPGTERDLVAGDFVNWGAEARYLKRYALLKNSSTLLLGFKYYQSRNTGFQGPGSSSSGPDFDPATQEFPLYQNQSNYTFPNLNFSFFGENIFRFSPSFSITPGFRYESIATQATGYYRRINRDLAGNVILDQTVEEDNVKKRDFLLLGIGISYKPRTRLEWYANISQNYRSVTFNDIRTAVPGQFIAENITDEKGFSTDVGLRGQIGNHVTFDASVFALFYDDKIGEYESVNPNGSAALGRLRDNIGTALTYGFESMFDWSVNRTFFKQCDHFSWNLFANLAVTDSQYLKSDAPNVEGNKVEFVPLINLKSGTGVGYKNFLSSVQVTYVSSQFTNANNSKTDNTDNTYGIFGEIPAYYVADFSSSYKWKNFKIEAGVTNFTNNKYFTRRATGYPGPGIIPSDFRSYYLTLEMVF